MYKTLTAANIRTMFHVPTTYHVDALLTVGTHPKSKAYPFFEEALKIMGIPAKYETIQDTFFSEIKSVITPHGRLWFDVIYGSAYASELLHTAALLGTKAAIHIGSFGALRPDIKIGDIILPERAYGDESTTRMYTRIQTPTFFSADKELRAALANILNIPVRNDTVISIQAMLGETPEDIKEWQKEKYTGVEMECATFFAVAKHFNVPAAAALYATDNLINNILITDASYVKTQPQQQTAKRQLYHAALVTLLQYIKKKGG